MTTLPDYAADLFTDEALEDPYPDYRELRDLGPAVRLTAHDLVAVSRYVEVRQVLDDPATFCSGEGVGLNDFINQGGQGTTLMSDGEAHRRQREVIGRPLTPKALSSLQPDVQARADRLIDQLVERESFDAVPDLAEVIPATWVPDLLGWPTEGRERLLGWGSDNFDALGPLNDRAIAAGPGLLEMVGFAQQVAAEGGLPAGSMAAGVLDAADRGEIEPAQCPMLLIDYLAPSLDTTISAIGNALWLFGTNPGQWKLLRSEPGRVKNAFNEVVRLETPVSCFTRVTTDTADIGGSEVPDGTRVLVSFASANRDERRWERAEEFDITREAAGHLGYGHGIHTCAGMGLARLEGAAVLSALLPRVRSIELGTPVRKRNNLIRSFASLPVTLLPA